MRSVDVPFWKEAINDEIDSLKINKTWFLTDLLPGCKSIGCKWIFLNYWFLVASNFLRPDIAYVVGRLGRYTHNPDHSHWLALERLFRYLKGTINYGIHYACYPAVIEGFCDANWISDSDETKSTSGYVFTLAGGAVAWKSAKQTIISRSTMEAEIIALDTASSEAEFLKNLLYDLPLLNKPIPPISMHCDSQVVIAKVTSKNFNEKRRHLRIRHKSIRNLITHGVISIDFIRSKNNLADPLTKGLTRVNKYLNRRGERD
uniref:Retrovirus-related Pol polyprotein from transposon TNT 1-94 n=1 Tax=Cajanus cajan TaxID=3821 RepID=A0A151TWW1_CAJCA|nr:Retrovirus-related Pol polyprotein from transposon TNT 1-94 [Cajanus cajan]